MRPETDEADADRSGDLRGRRGDPIGQQATATETRLDLELELQIRQRLPGGPDTRQELIEQTLVAGRHGDLPAGGLDRALRRDRIEDDQPARVPGIAKGDRLVEGRHAQAVGTRVDKGTRDRDHPVAVGVRLDNRLDEDRGPDDAADEVEIGC